MKTTLLKLPLIALLAFSFVFVACSDDDDPSVADQIEGTWKVTSVFIKQGTNPEVETTSSIEACDLDNLTVYSSDNTYQVTEGTDKCDPSDPDIVESGTWSLIDGDSKLINDPNEAGEESDTLTIVSISNSQAEFTETEQVQVSPDSTFTNVIRFIVAKQ